MEGNPYADPMFIRYERKVAQPVHSSSILPFSETYRPSKNYIKSAPPSPFQEEGVAPYLPDILVSYSADLLDVGRGL